MMREFAASWGYDFHVIVKRMLLFSFLFMGNFMGVFYMRGHLICNAICDFFFLTLVKYNVMQPHDRKMCFTTCIFFSIFVKIFTRILLL